MMVQTYVLRLLLLITSFAAGLRFHKSESRPDPMGILRSARHQVLNFQNHVHDFEVGVNGSNPRAVVDYPRCKSNLEVTEFRCKACTNTKMKNLVTVIETTGKRCIISGIPTDDAPVLTLVQNSPQPICKNTDGDGYSWLAGDGQYGCDPDYVKVMALKAPADVVSDAAFSPRKLLDEKSQLHKITKLQGEIIKLRSFKAGSLGKRLVHEVWPPEGRCTGQSLCGVFVHLHALYEVSGHPASIYCSGMPKYVTLDKQCYNKLRTVIVAPQLKSWFTENWNIDPEYPKPLSSTDAVYDDFFFPMVEKFLTEHGEKLDSDRIYVGGASGGASGAIYAALRRPDIFLWAITSDVCADKFLRRSKSYLDAMPPPAERKLKGIVLGRGDRADLETICDFDGFNMDSVAPLVDKKLKVQLRLIPGLGHGIWGHVFNEWPELHQMLVEGKSTNLWW